MRRCQLYECICDFANFGSFKKVFADSFINYGCGEGEGFYGNVGSFMA